MQETPAAKHEVPAVKGKGLFSKATPVATVPVITVPIITVPAVTVPVVSVSGASTGCSLLHGTSLHCSASAEVYSVDNKGGRGKWGGGEQVTARKGGLGGEGEGRLGRHCTDLASLIACDGRPKRASVMCCCVDEILLPNLAYCITHEHTPHSVFMGDARGHIRE